MMSWNGLFPPPDQAHVYVGVTDHMRVLVLRLRRGLGFCHRHHATQQDNKQQVLRMIPSSNYGPRGPDPSWFRSKETGFILRWTDLAAMIKRPVMVLR